MRKITAHQFEEPSLRSLPSLPGRPAVVRAGCVGRPQRAGRPAIRRLAGIALCATLGLLGACGSMRGGAAVYPKESFESNETYSRLFDAGVEETCEAARRALLGQGYLPASVRRDFVSASKNFQPESEVHVQIIFNVICVAEGNSGKLATAYVNAIEDRYILKKNPNSATVGVSAIGSVSIPLAASEDSLVKVASETIRAAPFYDRFFALMHRQLSQPVADEE